jgi:hypothetical protein
MVGVALQAIEVAFLETTTASLFIYFCKEHSPGMFAGTTLNPDPFGW